jgi:hypothetical protein
MSPARSPVLVVFLDGVGIGPADAAINPFHGARLPRLRSLLGGHLPCVGTPVIHGPGAIALPLDANLGVEGLPRSGTGQASLLTGVNTARRHGAHFGPWVPVGLRSLVEEESFLRRSVDAGVPTLFANAYPRGWPGPGGSRRIAGPPLAARGAGLLTLHADALREGRAVASEMHTEGWRRHLGHRDLPTVSPAEAGDTLGRLAAGVRVALYAHYATDTAGHRGGMQGAVEALERVDAFLTGLLGALPGDHLLVVVSDHGNIEDVRGGHTRNPALGIVAGPDADETAGRLESIVDVAGAVLARCGADGGG